MRRDFNLKPLEHVDGKKKKKELKAEKKMRD